MSESVLHRTPAPVEPCRYELTKTRECTLTQCHACLEWRAKTAAASQILAAMRGAHCFQTEQGDRERSVCDMELLVCSLLQAGHVPLLETAEHCSRGTWRLDHQQTLAPCSRHSLCDPAADAQVALPADAALEL